MPRWDGVQETIGEVQALKRQDDRDDAQALLEKVHKYVAPLMRRRRFRVHRLVEFLPRDANLLGVNVNRGQRISLRLRYNHDERQFRAFEDVLGTMLHELCHNVHGPHDRQFFALLDELTREMEDMLARGFAGDVFTGAGAGRTLAGRTAGGQRARAAPYRARRGVGRGRRLGGLGGRLSTAPQDMRARALEAAERRREADLRCRAVQRSEDLGSDEDDVVEISEAEFNSGSPSSRASSRPPSQPPSRPSSRVSSQPPDQAAGRPDKLPDDSYGALPVVVPEVISLLSDED